MFTNLQRKLEIGSHGERLRAVRELRDMHTREAYSLLELAVDDIDPQIREEALSAMRESVYFSGTPAAGQRASDEEVDGTHTEELF